MLETIVLFYSKDENKKLLPEENNFLNKRKNQSMENLKENQKDVVCIQTICGTANDPDFYQTLIVTEEDGSWIIDLVRTQIFPKN